MLVVSFISNFCAVGGGGGGGFFVRIIIRPVSERLPSVVSNILEKTVNIFKHKILDVLRA